MQRYRRDVIPKDQPGTPIIVGTWVSTAIFVVSSGLAVGVEGLRIAGAVVSLVLFAAGIVAFLIAFAIAVGRSRIDAIGIGGLFFLAGSSPKPVQRSMMAALALQTVVAFGAAFARPFTALAFGILVPMLGIGLAGLWGARYGRFDPRRAAAADEPSGSDAEPQHG